MAINLEVNTRCINCDLCRVICPENSITFHNDQYLIDNWSCSLCNLCVELCPTDAIKPNQDES